MYVRLIQVTQRTLLLGLATALVFVGTLGTTVRAADLKEEMAISPTDKHYSVNPGETINDDFTILNSGQVPYTFTTYSAPYSVDDTDYNANTTKTGGRADAFGWIQFKQSSWRADVRQTVHVPFTIQVAKYAAPGGHYAVIFAEEKPTSDAVSTGVTRKIRMGMIIYINVKGNAPSSGQVDNVDLSWYQPVSPITASMQVNNTGKVDFPVNASFVVSNLFGHVKYTQKVSDVYVIPDAPRNIALKWDNSPWLGIYKVKVEAQFLNTTSVKESYIIVAPRWLVYITVLILLLGVIRAVRILSNKSKTPRR